MTPIDLPASTDCPNCSRPIASLLRFTDDGPAFIALTCDDCGQIGPVETAPASSIIASIGPRAEIAA